MISEEIEQRAARVKLLLMDCDGVLTDGRITLIPDGGEQKTFHVRDGQGIVMLHRAGLKSGIISGRNSVLVERRAKELGIEFVKQGSQDKIKNFHDVLTKAGISGSETAFIGDDLADVPLMLRVNLAIAVADATAEVKQAAHFVTENNGGFGAVREVAELILRSQQKWNDLIKSYF